MSDRPTPRLSPLVIRLAVVVTLLGVGYVILSSPVSNWWDQRDRLSTAEGDLADVNAENDELRERLKEISEPANVELVAREDLGMVREGEESYTVLPPPTAGLALPNAWPFNRIAGALASQP